MTDCHLCWMTWFTVLLITAFTKFSVVQNLPGAAIRDSFFHLSQPSQGGAAWRDFIEFIVIFKINKHNSRFRSIIFKHNLFLLILLCFCSGSLLGPFQSFPIPSMIFPCLTWTFALPHFLNIPFSSLVAFLLVYSLYPYLSPLTSIYIGIISWGKHVRDHEV